MPRIRFTALATTLLLASFLLSAQAAIPGGDDPKAYTSHDLLRSRLDFNQRTLAGAYKTVGARDPRWDDAAVKFLDAMALYFTYGSAEPIYQTVDVPAPEEFDKLAKATEDAGCTDPLVQYCRGVVLLDKGERDAGARLVERSVQPMLVRKYPAYRVAAATGRVRAVWGKYLRYAGVARDAALGCADDAPGPDVRHALFAINAFTDPMTPAERMDFCKALAERKTASPWLVHLLTGRAEIKVAWEFRGTGFAHTVTEDGWKGMYEHLTRARDHLVKAHELHPEFPEAATEMITVAMGAGEQLKTTPREWFDKAARAQLDHYPAYEHYVYTLWPRWGGSHREMFQFGIECLQTGRFDTYVPYKLWTCVEQVVKDTDGDFGILNVPEVQLALWQMLMTMGEKAGGKEPRDVYPSMAAAIKWRTGDHAAAARVLDKLGDRVDPVAFEHVREWAPLAVSEVRAMTSPQAATLSKARTSAEQGDRDAAIAAYDEALKNLGPDHPGRMFADYRATALKLERDFATGKWVDITPGESMAPWVPASGQWNREKDGAITATSNPRGRAALVCRADFGPAFELRARLGRKDPAAHSIPVLLVHWVDYDWFHSAGIVTSQSALHVRSSIEGLNQPCPLLKGNDQVTVRVQNGTLTVLVDDKVVVESRPARERRPGAAGSIGLGINGVSPNLTARFTDVQIRRLENPNPPAKEE